MRLSLARYEVSAASSDSRSGMLLQLAGSDGIVAYSELAPLPEPGLSRETLSEVTAVLPTLGAFHVPASPIELEKLLLERVPPELPSLSWAIEILLADYAAKRSGLPLAAWYCGHSVPAVLLVNALLPRASSAEEIERTLSSGFQSFKLKISPELLYSGDDWLDLVAHKLPARASIRFDANQSFSLDSAKELCRRIKSRFSVEYIEEPLSSPTLADLTELSAAGGVPIAFDETLWLDTVLAEQACSAGVVRALILKPCMLGGFFACQRLVDSYRPETVTLTSTMEVGPGYVAGLHAALALKNKVNLLPCGFDTLKGYCNVFVPEMLHPHGGICRLPESAGLGVDFSALASGLTWEHAADWDSSS